MKKMGVLLIALIIGCGVALPLPLPLSSKASEIVAPKNILYPPFTVMLQDDFAGGSVTTGQIGVLGWIISGTINALASEANRPGLYRVSTGAVSGTLARITLYSGSQNALPADVQHTVLFIERLNTNDANTTVRIGSGNPNTSNPPDNGIYFEKLDADTNWFCVNRATTQTRVDSGVAVTTNFMTFEYRRGASDTTWYINGVAVCGSMTGDLPTGFFGPITQIINSAAVSKTIDQDYFEMKYSGFTR